MDPQARYAQVLREAAAILGGEAHLAAFLNIEPARLRRWMAGVEATPFPAFLAGLDVIADGPYAPHHRPVRVAVLPPVSE